MENLAQMRGADGNLYVVNDETLAHSGLISDLDQHHLEAMIKSGQMAERQLTEEEAIHLHHTYCCFIIESDNFSDDEDATFLND